jgi:hypothetical protein
MFYGPTDIWAILIRPKEYHVAFWDRQKFLIEYHSYSDKNPPDIFAPAFIQAVMKPLLREILATKGHYLLHAAAVTNKKKVGALLVGQGGAGKTTTALSLVRLGGQIISDDTITLTSQKERVMAHRSLRSFHVTEKTVDFFRELSPNFLTDKIPVAPELLLDPRLKTRKEGAYPAQKKVIYGSDIVNIYGSNCLAEFCAVEVIYLLRLTSGLPEIFEAPLAEAIGKLASAHTFARDQRLTRGAAELLTGIFDRLRVFILHTGSDPALTGQWLKDHLGQLATSSGCV